MALSSFQLVNDKNKTINNTLVVVEDGVASLISYSTNVATFNIKTKTMRVMNTQSNTTVKHINAFFELYGLEKCTKKQMDEKYEVAK